MGTDRQTDGQTDRRTDAGDHNNPSAEEAEEEKLPLDNILLFLLFEIARSYDLFNMTALSGQNPKRQNTEHRGTEGPTHRRVKTPKNHDASYPSLRRNIIS